MDWKRGFGIGLMLIGLFITLTSKVITGAVIGFQPKGFLGLFGFLVFIAGIFLILASVKSLEEEVGGGLAVYDAMKGAKGDDKGRYFMEDPEHLFTNYGEISLGDFTEMYEIVRDDPKLLERARRVYGRELLSIKGRDDYDSEIVQRFLEVLYEGKVPKIEKSGIEVKVEGPLTKREREEIKNAFRTGWKRDFNAAQKKTLERYDLGSRKTKASHLEVYSLKDNELKTTTSSTPSDYRVGLNFTKKLFRLLEKSRA